LLKIKPRQNTAPVGQSLQAGRTVRFSRLPLVQWAAQQSRALKKFTKQHAPPAMQPAPRARPKWAMRQHGRHASQSVVVKTVCIRQCGERL
jgi:hypothetical protein